MNLIPIKPSYRFEPIRNVAALGRALGFEKSVLEDVAARISQDDVRFGQGDFNVDAVVAIGVNTQQDIDEVIQKNSRVLSEAPVISVSVGSNPSAIGTIKWHDAQASGFSEVMVSTSEALQGNLLDESISNTLLTGIIAATNHFTNSDTSPKVMTMAAQLMAAGADQQKIMQELKTEQSKNIIESAPQFNTQQPITSDDGTDVNPVAESAPRNSCSRVVSSSTEYSSGPAKRTPVSSKVSRTADTTRACASSGEHENRSAH